MLIKNVGGVAGMGFSNTSVPVKCKRCGKVLQSKGSRKSIEICNRCKRKKG